MLEALVPRASEDTVPLPQTSLCHSLGPDLTYCVRCVYLLPGDICVSLHAALSLFCLIIDRTSSSPSQGVTQSLPVLSPLFNPHWYIFWYI